MFVHDSLWYDYVLETYDDCVTWTHAIHSESIIIMLLLENNY